MAPKLIITRPMDEGRAFANRVEAAMGRKITVIQSPAFRINPLNADLPKTDAVVFTSPNGVAQAERLGVKPGTKAFCVGDRTAQAAQLAGYQALSAGGDADALVTLITQIAPGGALLHLAGTHTRGNLSQRLCALGFDCAYRAVYEQVPLPPSDDLIAALAGNAPLVSPVFSPRSAAPLAMTNRTAPLHGVAISPAVAAVLVDLSADTVTTARQPDEPSMVRATCDVVLRLFDRG